MPFGCLGVFCLGLDGFKRAWGLLTVTRGFVSGEQKATEVWRKVEEAKGGGEINGKRLARV